MLTMKYTFERWVRLYNADTLRNYIDYSETFNNNGSPIYYAALLGLDDVLARILSVPSLDVNTEGGRLGTAASVKGHAHSVQLLLTRGAHINAKCGPYDGALQGASVRGRAQVVQILLDNGADVDAEGEVFGTALYGASNKGHVRVVQMLLRGGANVNIGGRVHGTPLVVASARGHAHVVQMLLDNGADVNAKVGPFGSTALYEASARGYEQVVQILLSKGADVNAQGAFPRHRAASGIIQRPRKCGADAWSKCKW